MPFENIVVEHNIKTTDRAQKLYTEGERYNFFALIVRPNMTFWRFFISGRTHTEGLLNRLIMSLFYAWDEIIIQIKLWELEHIR